MPHLTLTLECGHTRVVPPAERLAHKTRVWCWHCSEYKETEKS